MIYQHTLRVHPDEIGDRLASSDKEPEIFFVRDRGDDDLVHVPAVHRDAFVAYFPEAIEHGDAPDVPVFWTFQSAPQRGNQRHVEQIGANVLAMHGTAAVAVGHNCEHDLAVTYGYGAWRRFPGFYHEIGGKDYLFAVVGIEDDTDTTEFLLALYEQDENLVEFLQGLGLIPREMDGSERTSL